MTAPYVEPPDWLRTFKDTPDSEWLLRSSIDETLDLVVNYAVSARLANQRGATVTAGTHLLQCRASLIEVLQIYKQLTKEADGK